MAFIELPEEEYFTLKEKLEKIKEIVEANKILLNMGEHICRDIIYDILQIIEGEDNE